jgi:cytoskeletal protein CcmA (bactofilin family)
VAEISYQNPAAQGVAIIGKGTVIKGTVRSRQDIFLDGEVEGALDVEGCRLIVGPNGKVIADARAREVDVQGVIVGNVDATRISIRTSGRLEGDIRTAGIVIENGAWFKGRVDIVDTRAALNGEGPHGE